MQKKARMKEHKYHVNKFITNSLCNKGSSLLVNHSFDNLHEFDFNNVEVVTKQ